ncbi:5-deoxy-glucuronate isomerase [Pseudomonas duriflava]|uniref:5-deoxy-glucuronate isomerase n=1 Tax=Pseudomonas duriflava TaxID=459528 RepID=A0A562QDW4_9PSED|nr:5-deoxy-glucuronate isomerase [Pseudomonas duriflava]TWI54938.1 5-deoxy-glucuronate isomerase [Pseudomonas duriflava]
MDLLVKGSADSRTLVQVPDDALEYVGFAAYRLNEGDELPVNGQDKEVCIVLLSGKATITANHAQKGSFAWENIGDRQSVFEDKSPYAAYLPPATEARVIAHGKAEVAVCLAPGNPDETLPPRLIEPATMKRSTRGKDANTRYVCDILPDTAEAHSLLVVEVITPSGHSSSYPPHKHDTDDLPAQSFLEESYYHRLNPSQGFVFQRVYTDDRSIDQAMAVENNDVVLVPKGYHPVCVPWGYTSYYLNVMAGPKRIWKFHNDPAHEWLLQS